MKKLILIISLTSLKSMLFAQSFDTTFVKQVGVEICDCLSKQTYSKDGMEEYFGAFQNACAINILTTKYVYKLDEYRLATVANGKEFQNKQMFYEFFNMAQVVMMEDCDLVFELFEAQKENNARAVKNIYAEKALQDIPDVTKAIEVDNQTQFIIMRGLMYFSIDSLEQAERDLSTIEREPNGKNFPPLILLAYILELNGKFDEAIAYYEDLVKKKPIPFVFYLAAAKRKKKQQNE